MRRQEEWTQSPRDSSGGRSWRASDAFASLLFAQSCITQARMTPDVRDGLSAAALTLAQAVQVADVAKVQAMTIAEFSSPSAFGPTESLMQSTASRMGNSELRVVQIYRARRAVSRQPMTPPMPTSVVRWPERPPRPTSPSRAFLEGCMGFAMVEAAGDHPWLLSFLLRQDDGMWKLAGFYPHATHRGGSRWSLVLEECADLCQSR